MKFVSLCSGIEAASEAWLPLGWECLAVADNDKFVSEYLRQRHPNVPNLGDVSEIKYTDIEALGDFDVLIAGTPCFPAGALVLTTRGHIPIEEVIVGDRVLTHKGRWRKVLKVGAKLVNKTCVLKGFGHGGGLETTLDHPFWCREKRRKWVNEKRSTVAEMSEPVWADAEGMEGKYWATPTKVAPLPVPRSAENIAGHTQDFPRVNANFWWVVGRWLADGWVRDSKRTHRANSNWSTVFICCGKTEAAELWRKLYRTGLVWNEVESSTTIKFQCSNRVWQQWLLENFGRGAEGKRLPAWAYGMKAEYRKSLYEGYLSGDGCRRKNKRQTQITTVSRTLAYGIRLLSETLGETTALYKTEMPETCVIEGRTVNQKAQYQIAVKDGDKVNRRSQMRFEGNSWGLVRDVTYKNGPKLVYNLEVREDNTYTVDNIIVHNCQGLSNAGRRKGLEDSRSGLFYDFLRVVEYARDLGCRFVLWENVVGAFSSNEGRDFAVVVGSLAGIEDVRPPEHGWGREGAAVGWHGLLEWGVLDAQWFGVPQQRRRVFALLDFGDWRNRPPIILESESLRGDRPTRGSEGQKSARATRSGAPGVRGDGITYAIQERAVCENVNAGPDGAGFRAEVAYTFEARRSVQAVAPTLDAHFGEKWGLENQHIDNGAGLYVFEPVAFDTKSLGSSTFAAGEVAPTLRAMGKSGSHNNGGGQLGVCETVAVALRGREGGGTAEVSGPVMPALSTAGGGGNKPHVLSQWRVRRLSPEECEALQGFPRGRTKIKWRKGAAPAGNRYRVLGNSMAVPVISWIGRKIEWALAVEKDMEDLGL